MPSVTTYSYSISTHTLVTYKEEEKAFPPVYLSNILARQIGDERKRARESMQPEHA